MSDTYILEGIAAAFTCLLGAIAVLWKIVQDSRKEQAEEFKNTKIKLDECEEDRIKLNMKIGICEVKIARLETAAGLPSEGD